MLELENLKKNCYVKKYNDSLTNIIKYEDWVLGYCTENAFGVLQNILSISHKNKEYFSMGTPYTAIKGLETLFKCKFQFSKNFPIRGFTRMYIVD
jgi:hypothetical protein